MLVALACFVLLAGPVWAQALRADVIAEAQAQKAREAKEYEPTRAERAIANVKERFLEPKAGFFPVLDSVYGGGGITPGVGYRRFYGDQSTWFVRGLYSFKNYKLFEFVTTSPGHLQGRLTFDAQGGWRDATQVGYYGLGIETSQDARTNFRFKETFASGAVTFRPRRWAVLSGSLGVEDYALEEGEGSSPSIETVHTSDTAPGLGASPTFLHTSGTAGIDWRTSPGYSRTGGYYALTLHRYGDVDESYTFERVDADVVQHIPVLNETWVLSLRGRVQTTVNEEDVVPYFLLPSLGSGSTLRAYSSYRFRDRHSLLTQAEWRWFPNRLGLDMALFFDAGKVASRRGDLDLDGLKSNWGIGARFHGPAATPVRIELANGSEGWNLVFSGKAAF